MLPNLIHLHMCWALTNVPDDMNTVEHSDICLTYLFYMLVGSNQIAPTELWRTNRIGLEHAPWMSCSVVACTPRIGMFLVGVQARFHGLASASEDIWIFFRTRLEHDKPPVATRPHATVSSITTQCTRCFQTVGFSGTFLVHTVGSSRPLRASWDLSGPSKQAPGCLKFGIPWSQPFRAHARLATPQANTQWPPLVVSDGSHLRHVGRPRTRRSPTRRICRK